MKIKSLIYSLTATALFWMAFSPTPAKAAVDPFDPGDVVDVVFDYGTDQDPDPNVYKCTTWSNDGHQLGDATWTIRDSGESTGEMVVDIDLDLGERGEIHITNLSLPTHSIMMLQDADSVFDMLNPGNPMAYIAFDAKHGENGTTVKGYLVQGKKGKVKKIREISYRCINELKDGAFNFCRYCLWVLKS